MQWIDHIMCINLEKILQKVTLKGNFVYGLVENFEQYHLYGVHCHFHKSIDVGNGIPRVGDSQFTLIYLWVDSTPLSQN